MNGNVFLHECTIVIVCMCGRGYTGGGSGRGMWDVLKYRCRGELGRGVLIMLSQFILKYSIFL